MIALSNLGPKGPCKQTNKQKCTWLNWLECAVGDWQHPGQSLSGGRATYINSLGQGTNIQLPLSPECQFCPASMKYEVQQV